MWTPNVRNKIDPLAWHVLESKCSMQFGLFSLLNSGAYYFPGEYSGIKVILATVSNDFKHGPHEQTK